PALRGSVEPDLLGADGPAADRGGPAEDQGGGDRGRGHEAFERREGGARGEPPARRPPEGGPRDPDGGEGTPREGDRADAVHELPQLVAGDRRGAPDEDQMP